MAEVLQYQAEEAEAAGRMVDQLSGRGVVAAVLVRTLVEVPSTLFRQFRLLTEP
jgi:hypothetical protein